MVRKTREETENTRAQILQAALDCFYEKGFSKTSFDDIAERIDMTKGAVYWHFKDKAELLVALLKLHIQRKYEAGVNRELPETVDGLYRFFQNESEYIESHSNLRKFIFFVMMQVEWSDTVFNKVIAELGEIRNFHMTTVLNALTSAQKNGEIPPSANIDEAAWLIVNSWRGALNFYVTEPVTEFSLTKDFMYGLDIVLNWLKKEGK